MFFTPPKKKELFYEREDEAEVEGFIYCSDDSRVGWWHYLLCDIEREMKAMGNDWLRIHHLEEILFYIKHCNPDREQKERALQLLQEQYPNPVE